MDATRLLSILVLFCLLPTLRLASGQESSRFDTAPKFEPRSSQLGQRRTASPRVGPRVTQRKPAVADVRVQYHSKPDLFIPFDLSSHADSVAEVRLYKSEQQGRDWALYKTQSPRAEGFHFQAPRDGEYWFAVRTTDATGRQTTANPTEPELKLVVDTQQPQLDVRMNADGQGYIAAEWIAEDLNLAAHTFTIQFQDERGRRRQLEIDTPEPNDPRQQWHSSARFEVPTNSRNIEVVVEVMDRAENTVRKRQIVSVDGSRQADQRNGQRSGQQTGSRFERDPSLRSTVTRRPESDPERGG